MAMNFKAQNAAGGIGAAMSKSRRRGGFGRRSNQLRPSVRARSNAPRPMRRRPKVSAQLRGGVREWRIDQDKNRLADIDPWAEGIS